MPSSKYPPHQYVLMTDAGEPSCYEEAVSDEHKNECSEAMKDEMKSLYEDEIGRASCRERVCQYV